MIRSEEYWRRLNVELISTQRSRAEIRKTMLEAQKDIIELHVMLRQKQESQEWIDIPDILRRD